MSIFRRQIFCSKCSNGAKSHPRTMPGSLPDFWNDFLDQMFPMVLEIENSLMLKLPGKNEIPAAAGVICDPEQKENSLTN